MTTVEDVRSAIEGHIFLWKYTDHKTGERSVSEFSGWGQWEEQDGPVKVPDIGTVEVVENFGGEGLGSSMHMIFVVTDHFGTVRHFKKIGWYASHDGGYWEGPFIEVTPAERTVTVYEPKN